MQCKININNLFLKANYLHIHYICPQLNACMSWHWLCDCQNGIEYLYWCLKTVRTIFMVQYTQCGQCTLYTYNLAVKALPGRDAEVF